MSAKSQQPCTPRSGPQVDSQRPMIPTPFPVVTLRNDSRCRCCRYWRILVDRVIVGETANTTEARTCAEELAVKPAAAAQLRDSCAADDLREQSAKPPSASRCPTATATRSR
jgi:hypothetical protein